MMEACDCPNYGIVKACEVIGVEKPADVLWIKHERKFYEGQVLRRECTCKAKTDLKLAVFRFTYESGDEVVLGVAQCPRCKTVHWVA